MYLWHLVDALRIGKERRPGVAEQVDQDLEIIHNLAVRVS